LGNKKAEAFWPLLLLNVLLYYYRASMILYFSHKVHNNGENMEQEINGAVKPKKLLFHCISE